MEDVIRALLAGASDQTILEMLERLEKESEIQTEGEDAESRKYESCVTLRGAPILPPVMTEEKRLECLKWRRAALEVEERIGNKRRELLAENIHRIAAGALNRHTNHQEEVEDEGLAVYQILRSHSRAADEAVNNFKSSNIPRVEIAPSHEKSGDSIEKEEPVTQRPDDEDLSRASDNSTSVPKSFAEIKKLVKTLPPTPRSARYHAKIMSSGPSSDISSSDDEATTMATSLISEVNDEDLFSLRSVVSRRKGSPEKTNVYDSLVSVDTVIENTDYREEDLQPEERTRRGSYSLSQPSPVLLAYMQKMGDNQEEEVTNDSGVASSAVSRPRFTVSAAPDRRDARKEFLAGISKAPSITKPAPVSGEEDLRLELGSVVSTTESCPPSTGSQTYRTDTTITPSITPSTVKESPTSPPGTPEKLKLAVTRLAMQQQESLNQLIQQQEAARLRLREEFEKQQQELMAEIFCQFPQLRVSASSGEDSAGRLEEVEVGLKTSIKEIARQDSLVSDSVETDQDISISSDISPSEADGDKENINTLNTSLGLGRKGTFTKADRVARPPVAVTVPEEALLARHRPAWARLTALARGHLTRLLLRTEKVEGIKRTIKEAVACAVQLHTESGGEPPSKEDLQLHARLLAQIESACQALHNIFFTMDTAERMRILALNRRAMRERDERRMSGQVGEKKRISAATEARLKAKAGSAKVESWDDKRERVIRNAQQISLQTGRVLTNSNRKSLSARSRTSPRVVRKVHVRKSKPILSTKLRQTPLLNLDSPYFKREKPVWK